MAERPQRSDRVSINREVCVKRLILTTDVSGAASLRKTGLADIVVPIGFRLVGGRLAPDAELAASLVSHAPDGWLWKLGRQQFPDIVENEIGLIDLCQRAATIELWIDPDPNAQLTLVWLLAYLRHHPQIALKLTLVQADLRIGEHLAEEVAEWRLPAIEITNHHLELASAVWQAYRAATPQPWFDLLGMDLSVLPQLRGCLLELLEELPMGSTGLGATEMRMLELISAGNAHPFDVFPGDRKPNRRRVFGYWEVGALLDGLAHCPAPAVSGLDEGPFTLEMHNDHSRFERYKGSKLKLTALGAAVLAGTEDFSRHNPIHRWWGGTELTGDRLWRWDPANLALIAP
jgi:hypothetical protein